MQKYHDLNGLWGGSGRFGRVTDSSYKISINSRIKLYHRSPSRCSSFSVIHSFWFGCDWYMRWRDLFKFAWLSALSGNVHCWWTALHLPFDTYHDLIQLKTHKIQVLHHQIIRLELQIQEQSARNAELIESYHHRDKPIGLTWCAFLLTNNGNEGSSNNTN